MPPQPASLVLPKETCPICSRVTDRLDRVAFESARTTSHVERSEKHSLRVIELSEVRADCCEACRTDLDALIQRWLAGEFAQVKSGDGPALVQIIRTGTAPVIVRQEE